MTRTLEAVIPYHETNALRDRSDVHQYTAVIQTIALLSEALPDRFETSHAWGFSWDKKANWQCRVIADALSSLSRRSS